jgi:hypothetical protein
MRRAVLIPLVLLVVGGTYAAADPDRALPPGRAVPAVVHAPAGVASVPVVALIRSAAGVPDSWAGRAAAVAGVQRVVRLRRGQMLLRSAMASSGRVVQRVKSGYAIPVDTLAGSARGFASMLPAELGAVVTRLHAGQVALSQTAARLRRVGVGATLTYERGLSERVGAIVADSLMSGAEEFLPRSASGFQSRNAELLVRMGSSADKAGVDHAFAGVRAQVLWLGQPFGTARSPIAQPEELKRRFGEVAVRLPFGPDWITLDPAWVRANIVTGSVPVLGVVTVNSQMLPRLRAALGDLARRGLGGLVNPGDFAGCYAPRRIPSTGSLSLHALGLACDLNAGANPPDQPSHQDQRLVRTMERHGFTWGGGWPTYTDPMHFEFHGSG